MRILQINCVYGQGSTGKITRDIHMALHEKGIESYVCYGRGKKTEDKNVILVSSDFMSRIRRMISSLDGMTYNFTRWTNLKLHKEILTIDPDVVHLQCINGYFVDVYRLLEFLKRNNIPTVLTLHAEFMHTGGCGYALDCNQWIDGCQKYKRLKSGLGVIGLDNVKKNYLKMKHVMKGFEKLTVVGVSEWISSRALKSQIMSDINIMTIHNGIDTTNVFYPRNTYSIRQKYGIPEEKKIVLSVVPNLISDLKGGKLMMELAHETIFKDHLFVIVGAKESVEDKPENLIIIPYTESQNELAEIYSTADVFVMGSKMDNYPTVCIEANSCGTPVVGFDVGGVSETIYEDMGCTVPYGDIEMMKTKINEWIEKKNEISKNVKNAVVWRNSKERMIEDYLKVYCEILGEK